MSLHLAVHQRTIAAAAAAAAEDDEVLVVVAMINVNTIEIEKDVDVHASIQNEGKKLDLPLIDDKDKIPVIDLYDHSLFLPIVLSTFSLTYLPDHYNVLNSN